MKAPKVRCAVLVLMAALGGCGTTTSQSAKPAAAVGPNVPASPSESALAVVNAADRSDADKKLDPGRHPAELLSFFRIAPGMRVAEIGAGGGYTTELLARAVGPSGQVYGQNSKALLERFAEKPWSERLAKPIMKNVVRIDREFEDPLPPEAKNLDAVFCVLFYHDLHWIGVDVDKMNRAVFGALKPGGIFAIVDHSGRDGTGATEAKTLHRIEEKVVRAEIEKAGFRLRNEGSFLRNASDPRDWSASPGAAGEKRGTSDRFVLAFEKP